MKILNCLICEGELDIIGEDGYRKIIKCKTCGYQSGNSRKKEPEVVVIRKIERN